MQTANVSAFSSAIPANTFLDFLFGAAVAVTMETVFC